MTRQRTLLMTLVVLMAMVFTVYVFDLQNENRKTEGKEAILELRDQLTRHLEQRGTYPRDLSLIPLTDSTTRLLAQGRVVYTKTQSGFSLAVLTRTTSYEGWYLTETGTLNYDS